MHTETLISPPPEDAATAGMPTIGAGRDAAGCAPVRSRRLDTLLDTSHRLGSVHVGHVDNDLP